MKKKLSLIAAISLLVIIHVSALDINPGDTSGKKDMQPVNIESKNGENFPAAPGSISADSLFMTGVENLQDEMSTGFKIRRVEKKINKTIAQAGKNKIKEDTDFNYHDETDKRKNEKKKNRFWKIAGTVGEVLGTAVGVIAQSALAAF